LLNIFYLPVDRET